MGTLLPRTLGLLAVAVLACTDDGTTPSTNPSIAVTVSPPALSIAASQSATFLVRVTRSGGFEGPVSLSLEGRPADMTATFSPGTLFAGRTASTLTISVARSVPTGAYSLVLRSTANGAPDASVALSLTVTPPPAISLAVSPGDLTVFRGEEGTATVTITREGGYTGSVSLALAGAPTGVVSTFTPVTSGATFSSLAIRVGQLVPLGTYDLTIRGSAPGRDIPDATVLLRLVVALQQGFALTADAEPVEVPSGGSGRTGLTITRTAGFAGPVQLGAVSNAPPGVTLSVTPAVTSGTTASLEIQTGGSVPAGVYRITVTGAAEGIALRTASVRLVVTGTGSEGVTWSFCEQTGLPVWVALQDGLTGTWVRTLPAGNRYTFTITHGVAGIAWVHDQGDGTWLNLAYGTAVELRNAGPDCTGNGTLKSVWGVQKNLAPDQTAAVSFAGNRQRLVPGTAEFVMNDVRDGIADLIATATRGEQEVTGFLVRRGLNPAPGSWIPELDWTGPDRVAPVIRTITMSNADPPGAIWETTLAYHTANGPVPLLYALAGSANAYAGLPTSSQAPGDLHVLTQTQSGTGSRSVTALFHTAADLTLSFGSRFPAEGFVVGWSGELPRIAFTRPGDYGQLTEVVFDDWMTVVHATFWPAYGLGEVVEYSQPDFTSVAGWNPRWGLRGIGDWFSAKATVTGWTAVAEPGRRPLVDGAVIRSASRGGTFPQ